VLIFTKEFSTQNLCFITPSNISKSFLPEFLPLSNYVFCVNAFELFSMHVTCYVMLKEFYELIKNEPITSIITYK